jgi:hypothetical protein
MPRILAVSLIAAASLGLGGCGGSSASSSSSGSSTTTPGSAPSSARAGGDNASFCTAAKAELEDVSAQLQPLVNGSGTPESISKNLDTIEKGYQKVIAIAPAEIKGDLETLLTAVKAMKTAYASTSDPAAVAAQLLPILSEQKLQDASTHLSAWATKNCGAAP